MSAHQGMNHQITDVASHTGSITEVVQHSSGLKAAVGGVGVGAASMASPIDWLQVIGLCLTAMTVLIAGGSLLLGYLNYKERVRENNMKAIKLEVNENEPNE